MTSACRPLTAWRRTAAWPCAAVLLLASPAGADTCTTLAFGAPSSGSTGTTPVAVVAADFNRDGKTDAVATNSGGSSLTLLLGNGAGALTPTFSTGAGSSPIDVAAGDLDRDGFLDLVVAQSTGQNVGLLKGNGTSFATPTAFDATVVPTRVALADFDRNGWLDLVVVSETGNVVKVFAGTGGVGFGAKLAEVTLNAPVAAVAGDWNGDGTLDLAVASKAANQVFVLLGDGTGFLGRPQPSPSPWLPEPFATVDTGLGTGPLDLAAGDLDRNGRLDIVTANPGNDTTTILIGAGDGNFTPQSGPAPAGQPERVALADLDRDSALDLVVLDRSGARLVAFKGKPSAPYFDSAEYPAPLPGSDPRDLAVADFTSDGRVDFVTVSSTANLATVVPNTSGPSCPRTSFGLAPRAYYSGDGPASVAVGDFDENGRPDMVVASALDGRIQFLRAIAGGFAQPFAYTPTPGARAVAAADFNFDGHADIVAALGAGSTGKVQILIGNGDGTFSFGTSQDAGQNTSAVVVGDFDGNGSPDVAATSEGDGRVWVFLGDGAGGLSPSPANPVRSGLSAPRALVAAELTDDGRLDLAIAASGSDKVHVLRNDGGGAFTEVAVPTVGSKPWGIAAADLDGLGRTDLVTADNESARVSVLLRTGAGTFAPAAAYTVDVNPTAVAAVDLAGSAAPDVVVTSWGKHSVSLLENSGTGALASPTVHPVHRQPVALAPIDADDDGRLDLAVACQRADTTVLLLNRGPGPPFFSAAPRVAVGAKPASAVAADLDGDGDLDLAVANEDGNSVTLLENDGSGSYTAYLTRAVGEKPSAIVAGDWNRDGRVDLALNAPGAAPPAVSILLAGGSPGQFPGLTLVPVGTTPDALAAGDFDRDGDLDLAVCDEVTGSGPVYVLRNDGGAFSVAGSALAGSRPTAVVAADLDRDGRLDLAVANNQSNNVSILKGAGDGTFSPAAVLPLLAEDLSPVAIAASDLDGDGDDDLAAASFVNDRLNVFRNLGALSFATPVPFAAPYLLQGIVPADVNRDGKPDLATAAGGLSVFPGKGDLDFAPPEHWVAAQIPRAIAIGDLNRDGWLDAAVVNETSNDVSILLSTACTARRLGVTLQPAACGTGAGPYPVDAVATAQDDAGNPAVCAIGDVTADIVPGTGTAGAVLTGPGAPPAPLPTLPLASGTADFTGTNGLAIDRAGRRYRLQFSLGSLRAESRSFTLGAAVAITGPLSFCPATQATYAADSSFDTYAWRLDASPSPFAYTPSVVLQEPPLTLGQHQVSLSARVDGCTASASRTIWYSAWQRTTLSISGLATVCVDCIGGTVTPGDEGGGAVTSRQWGYRTQAGGPITTLTGETGPTYVVKGTDFPGPGTYYIVVSTGFTCPASPAQVSLELAVTVSAEVPTGEVQSLAVTSRGTSTAGENVLQWVNSTSTPEEIRVRWRKSTTGTSDCAPPLTPEGGAGVFEQSFSPPVPTKSAWPHGGLELDTTYCYAVFVKVAGVWSPGRIVEARPFDSGAGPVKWAYSTGATAVAPPTVGVHGIVIMSNDRTVHSVTRGSGGGVWPIDFVPRALTGVAHSRSPIVPFRTGTALFPGRSILFAGDDAGDAHGVDTFDGQPVWPARPQGKPVVGAPGGLFAQYGGVRDLLVAGTRDGTGPNELRGLDPATGLTVGTPFSAAGTIGAISGSPVIDYFSQRVVFASRSRSGGPTIWCVVVDATTPFTPCSGFARNIGDVDGSPVLRGDRLYVGNTSGVVYSLDAATGGDDRTFVTGDGPVKGFLFPDRRNDDLIFATNTRVFSISDDGSTAMPKNWEWTDAGLNPSLVLYWPGTSYVYVGSRNGRLYQLDFGSATPSTPPASSFIVLGDGVGQIGAPSLDNGIDIGGGKRLLVVGSEAGVVYGVAVPF